MALALKYRPDIFDDVVGNTELINSVKVMLMREPKEIPHSWLFTGPSGNGKTTLARIIATELGCSEDDMTELDSADFRGIDSIREVRRQMYFAPIKGNVRVWIFDECHQLTKDAQEALLKALEEAPEHAYFILATTEPEKLKTTLKNRCVSYVVEPIGNREMATFLTEIVVAEEKECSVSAIKAIAESSLGSCRAALQILETVIDLPPAKMRKGVKKAAEQQSAVIDLCRALFKGMPWKTISDIIKRMEGTQPETVRLAVMGYCSSVLLNVQDAPQAYIVMDCFKEPLFTNGKAGLILMAYEAVQAADEPVPF